MKTTRYFDFRRTFADRAEIQEAWIEEVIRNPLRTIRQSDGRIKVWGKVAGSGVRYLRVVLLSDGDTVHNAFFDRDFRE